MYLTRCQNQWGGHSANPHFTGAPWLSAVQPVLSMDQRPETFDSWEVGLPTLTPEF